MRPDPRPDRAGNWTTVALVAVVAALAGGLFAAYYNAAPDTPEAQAPEASMQKAYLLLSSPGQERETLQGVVRGSSTARYVVTAEAGEALDVRLTAANPDVYFTLRTPGGDVLLYDSSDPDADHRFSRRLAPGGHYRLEVRLAEAAARRKTVAPYTLSVARGGKVSEIR